MIVFFSFLSDDPHYNMVLIPYFVPALSFLTGIIYNSFSRRYAKNMPLVFLVVFFCFVFSEGFANFLWDFTKPFHGHSIGAKLVNAGKMIDENTKPGDKIISLGENAYIYLFTQRACVSKYFYQGYWLKSIPGAREDFLNDVLTGKPAVIAIYNDEGGIGEIDSYWHGPILEMMEREYRLLSGENGFRLFIRE
jgi:hypothetical protein